MEGCDDDDDEYDASANQHYEEKMDSTSDHRVSESLPINHLIEKDLTLKVIDVPSRKRKTTKNTVQSETNIKKKKHKFTII